MVILGIESSCDETAVAIVEDGRKVIAEKVLSQADTHSKYGGVVPEIASRAHTEAIYPLTADVLKLAGISMESVGAVAATYAPGLIGALLSGLNFAKALAYRYGLPLVPVHHIRGHIAAAYLGNDAQPPFLAFVASGGHTSLIDVGGFTRFSQIGRTRDDAAGEAFDKIARAMGLPYPGGAALELLAADGDPAYLTIPIAKTAGNQLDFSFSGIKTFVVNHINTLQMKTGGLSLQNKRDIAAAFTKNVVDTIKLRAAAALKVTGHKKFVCAGGVLANGNIRRALAALCSELEVELLIPPKKYCGDNGAMIAAQGFYELLERHTADLFLNAFASKDV